MTSGSMAPLTCIASRPLMLLGLLLLLHLTVPSLAQTQDSGTEASVDQASVTDASAERNETTASEAGETPDDAEDADEKEVTLIPGVKVPSREGKTRPWVYVVIAVLILVIPLLPILLVCLKLRERRRSMRLLERREEAAAAARDAAHRLPSHPSPDPFAAPLVL